MLPSSDAVNDFGCKQQNRMRVGKVGIDLAVRFTPYAESKLCLINKPPGRKGRIPLDPNTP
jgi:hypothetical protein